MHVQVFEVEVTTDAAGAAEEYSAQVNGLLDRIRYVKSGSGNFADGVDFTITLEDSGETLWAESNVNASATRAPRQATHATDGTASLYAAAGEPVEDRIAVNGKVKIVIASGGDTKTGTFLIYTI